MTGVSEALTAPDALTALISRLRELMEAATPGDWKVEFEAEPEDDFGQVYICHPATICDATVVATMGWSPVSMAEYADHDAALIVEMRNGLPLLLEAYEQLRHKLWLVACHATGGGIPEIEGIDRSTNDICVQISAHRNVVYQGGKDAALSATDNRAPVEDGWRGIAPSDAMLDAGRFAYKDGVGGKRGISRDDVRTIWSAMLAAASTPPTGSRETDNG